ncbi:FtsX-like permease family protein [Paenibacillus arenilitoris]|uniref:ABC transporter permease n=1 Tax=Paenibacillus arenilitoris TaxID=2772299 RepID=A0A927CGS3_9BACL|nr:ABC transporter permease [Paenibacillus arenilitoris]MBD2867809.1 ABC transporter permease [Paenibacillus arenilitoris]
MNFRQFAFNNVLRKKRTYAAHFMSSAFAVMIFFIYAVLLYHPSLQGQLAASGDTASLLGTMGLKISQYFIFIFSFFFLLYSAGAFLKVRKREFGILMMLGMSDKQRNRLVFIENMIIGLVSILVGIGAGILFTKLFLLVSERLLMLEEGLPFYVPIQAVWTTAGAFLLLFLVISLLTSRVGKRHQLLELIKSDEKPREEPKASVWLSLLALVLLLAGYGMVFYFVLGRAFSLILLSTAIGCVVLGTYLLFTQLSVYAIRALKKKERLFFRKINLLTLSDLAYRMRDNANMFFMVATVTAVAFCGIGSCLAMGDPNLSEKENPYAFTYTSHSSNEDERNHLGQIEGRLTEGGFSYERGSAYFKYTDDGLAVAKLSDYNRLAEALGHEAETLSGPGEAIIASGVASRANKVTSFDPVAAIVPETANGGAAEVAVKKRTSSFIFSQYSDTLVVADELFDTLAEREIEGWEEPTYYYYVVDDWEKTLRIARELNESIPSSEDGQYFFDALALDWHKDKQLNGMLLIISVLVGVVFFTFAASFIYFRLYADLERDEKQYQMISKLGLSGKELNKLVTRQLTLMFFLPLAMAMIHSGVAFINIKLLVQFPMLGNAIGIYVSFFLIQLIYFFMIRWRYLRHMQLKLS